MDRLFQTPCPAADPVKAQWGFLFIPPESKVRDLLVDDSVVPRMLADKSTKSSVIVAKLYVTLKLYSQSGNYLPFQSTATVNDKAARVTTKSFY